ncbi:hypothetical protein GN244_ATG14199 [Phytophthora infestans]|uniref:Uncharacterized protein n=1 Tax=Phytophthora infestans TaxID=4787 RepID=A0A833RXJ7_PHYIN|nr:hypothetical protein GN244_ATG20492 [Phytophthora infestans]KAF4033884.1 hypothetical protein GN244_ATG14199 [Phytophthora infestans]
MGDLESLDSSRDYHELRTETKAVQHSKRSRMELKAFTTSFLTAVSSMIRASLMPSVIEDRIVIL